MEIPIPFVGWIEEDPDELLEFLKSELKNLEIYLKLYMKEDKNTTGMSQKEVAEVFGVSRNYIQQVEKRAMEKIRAEMKKRGIKIEDYLGGD